VATATTYSAKPSEIKKEWFIIDATDLVTGRLASQVALRLRGKHKPTYTPHMDCGDCIVIINAEKVCLTGNKADRKDGKKYYRHTGHPGGIKEVTAGTLLEGRFPERVIKKAIERMISRNPLGRKQMSNLYIYGGAEHPHAGQQPKPLDIAALNVKNKKRVA
jgi:large subunit ribosomal protein L13